MGRQLRRVALDFSWPHNKVWEGFINPHNEKCHSCKECNGSGYSPTAYQMYQQWWGYTVFDPASRGSRPWTPEDAPVRAFAERNVNGSPGFYGTGEAAIHREGLRLCGHWNNQWMHHMSQADVDALIAAGELQELTHTWSKEDRSWHPKVPAPQLTAAEVNAWSIGYMGSTGSWQYHVAKAECERLGVPALCAHCHGDGSVWDSPEAEKQAEEWQPKEPPAGQGYQLWETVTEGSPISPVFATAEALARWLVDNPHGIDEGTTFEQWLTFIAGDGWAPSMAIIDGQVVTGVVAATL